MFDTHCCTLPPSIMHLCMCELLRTTRTQRFCILEELPKSFGGGGGGGGDCGR